MWNGVFGPEPLGWIAGLLPRAGALGGVRPVVVLS
jgi:hypothetical protein